ncbi:GrpB family protein [Demequina maris]|uniref:GrpB family protein n=1 Tax=Demequina maris TaxID=1638982 RepID=UPI000780A555|nr:GrpB family protein [Demequina maris]
MTSSPRAPHRRRADVTTTELVGGVERRTIEIVDPDQTWPETFAEHRARVAAALGPVARSIEHIGSTSVPGLAAKPIIDVLVTVEDITAEEDYLAPLLDAGYVLRVREPGHRLVRTPELDVHVHLLEVGDQAAEDYLILRDRLRRSPSDRALYEGVKRALAARDWPDMNAYADAKTAVIEEIKSRGRDG